MKNELYYSMRPVLPRWFQIQLRRHFIKNKIGNFVLDITRVIFMIFTKTIHKHPNTLIIPPANVNVGNLRKIHYAHLKIYYSACIVNILTIHEIFLAEPTDLIDDCLSCHNACT